MNSSNQSSSEQPAPAQAPISIPVNYAEAEALSKSGTWSETQVIESIKDANLRNKCPNRTMSGQATLRLGDSVVQTGPMVGQLILSKPRKRTRIKRFLSYLSS